MKNLVYTKKIVGLSILSITVTTPVIIANSNVQINSFTKLTNYSQNIDTSSLVQIQNNQAELLKEISNKYDESQVLFATWKNNYNVNANIDNGIRYQFRRYFDFNDFLNTIKLENNHASCRHAFSSKGVCYSQAVDFVKKFKEQNGFDLSNVESFHLDNNFNVESLTILKDVAWGHKEKSILTGPNAGRNWTEPINTNIKFDQFSTNGVDLFDLDEKQNDLFNLYNIDVLNAQVGKNFYDSFDKENNQFIKTWTVENKYKFYEQAKLLVSANGTNFIEASQNDSIINFDNKNINWDKFFILNISDIENNNIYYYGTNRPTIEFAFNLPLVNAINWYSKLPSKFIELRKLIEDIELTWSDSQYLFNEIFGSKNIFFDFMNTYLFNFANFYYDEITFNNFVQFLTDLKNKEPLQEIRNVIKELITTKKDVQYKNIIIPACAKNDSLEDIKSGSSYNIDLLANSLDLNTLNFSIDQIISNKLWLPNEFININSINKWNTYNDVIFPIILSQNIFVEYEDHFGNQYQTVVYDGSTKSFVNNAIKVGAVSGDFNTPYSTIKIKNISIGNFETKPYLGTNVEINNQNEFSEFINQSKLNATKTINGKQYASQDGFNDPIYMQANDDSIEIKFRYIAEEKQVEEGAWSDIHGDNEISPFMLIPDEAWDDIGAKPDSNPDSSLEDILWSWEKQILIQRTLSRPFILKKDIAGLELEEARQKYIYPEIETLTFTKDNIRNLFLNDGFTNKYNELSNKPWWTWTFQELVDEETNYNKGVSGSFNVVQDNSYQSQWFQNFLCNPNLANKTMSDFFPKTEEGRFFVIGSYKPAIDSTQIKLTEEAGFYYAGVQKDVYNMITNFNYVVELEVKNKTYTSKLNELNIASNDYKGQNLSFRKYQQLMNSLTKEWVNYFAIDNSRFKAEQIKDPNIEYIYTPSDDPFIQTSYGYIKIDYQNSIPIVNQIGNEVVYEQLPFNLNKIIGFAEFRHKYNKYIIESKEEWDKLSQFEQSKVILIDSQNNEILIGGYVIAQEKNFKVQGAPRIIISDEYVDPSLKDNPYFGFNQKTKEYISLQDLRNKWTSYSQKELFNILFGNYNYNSQAELLKERIKQFGVTLYVRIDDQYRLYWGYYWYEDGEKLGDETFDYIQLIKIEAVRTDLIELSKFTYGYNRDKDTIVSFSSLVSNIKNIDKFAQFFNLNEFQLNNFINGIKKIEVIEQNQENGLIKIQITLNENYVLYNENDSFIITINAKELIKYELDSLSLNNFSQEIKEELSKRNNEEQIQYLNSLDLNTKLSLFTSSQSKFFVSNLSTSHDNNHSIQDIVFSYNEADLVADVKFNNPNLVLDAKTNKTLTNFDYNLRIDLGLIDPFKQKVLPWMLGGIISGGILLIAALAFIFYRRHRQKEQLLKSDINTNVLSEKDLFNDNSADSSVNINNLNNNIENSL